jgi:uncharacterized protein (DUF1501 family)
MLSRRQFIERTSLVSLYPVVPALLGRIAHAAPAERDARVLVVIQLDGGNDGINTVVPFGDDGYGRNRESLRLELDKLHRLNDHVGLHPQMNAAKELFDDGRFTIVQGVGYPNPDKSHFRSMRIWQTARLDDVDHNSYGWLGRALDTQQHPHNAGQPGAIYVGPKEVPIALWGRRAEALTVTRLDDLKLPFAASQLIPETQSHVVAKNDAPDDDLSLFTTRQVLSAYAAADEFGRQTQAAGERPSAKYPSTQLATHLNLISQLIRSGSAARVFYATQSGYDTHAAQLYTHSRLLREFSDALKAFLDDLQSAALEDRVVVLAFSEFGRRVKENASQGTDHGAAGPVFLAGSKTVGGLVGATPDLSDLQEGDLKMSVDMREIYAAILEDWLDVKSADVLGGSFSKAAVFRA